MDDLGSANHSNDTDIVMLGGGNPAPINQLNEILIKEITKLIDESEIASVIGRYDSPRGNAEFIKALSIMFNKHYKWDIDESNIVITNGSQNSFFSLFNLLAGEMQDGSSRKILLPIVPEYIGYADQGLTEDIFVSIQPDIVFLDNKQYKYQINFDKLKSTIKQNNIGAQIDLYALHQS